MSHGKGVAEGVKVGVLVLVGVLLGVGDVLGVGVIVGVLLGVSVAVGLCILTLRSAVAVLPLLCCVACIVRFSVPIDALVGILSWNVTLVLLLPFIVIVLFGETVNVAPGILAMLGISIVTVCEVVEVLLRVYAT